MAVQGFYWLIPGELAGCGRPGGPGGVGMRRDDDGGRAGGAESPQRVEDDLLWLKGQGITALLSLTEAPLEERLLDRHRFAWLHLPVDDMTAPAPLQLRRALGFIDWQRALGRGITVHCRMGQGRTGTILASHLIRDGLPAEEAIRRLRAMCPGALGSPSQERAVRDFARRRDWVL